MWGSITILYLQLFQQVLLLLNFDLQVAVMGDWGGGGGGERVGEAGSHAEADLAAPFRTPSGEGTEPSPFFQSC